MGNRHQIGPRIPDLQSAFGGLQELEVRLLGDILGVLARREFPPQVTNQRVEAAAEGELHPEFRWIGRHVRAPAIFPVDTVTTIEPPKSVML